MSLRVAVRIAVFCARDTEFSAILGVSLRVAVRIDGICARDTGFSAVLGVSLWVVVRIAGFCACDTGFSAVFGVSLQVAGGAECGVLRSRHRFFCCFWCVAAGGGADCGAGRLRMLAGDGWEDVAWLPV